MTKLIQQSSTSDPLIFTLTSSGVPVTGKSGSVVVKISKNGSIGAVPGGAISEIDSTNVPGMYAVAGNATDTNTLGSISLYAKDAASDAYLSVDIAQIVPFNPRDTSFGFAAVNVSSAVKKNFARAAFPFVMTDSTTHQPKTGLTVTSQRSIDGAAFVPCANSASEVGNGSYIINLNASDLNGNCIVFLFTASGADNTYLSVFTQP